ncbi:hypothetical protein PV327_006930 [Microctonus hyperodae]|uniref:Uncharacterized protein n=1 Tax=Microctonus hyperodae TaxID=165561 RepID=A0AA39KIV9_MICHY|nr:hypothetical protein PV327_006930 [Microctonus hyperodae]
MVSEGRKVGVFYVDDRKQRIYSTEAPQASGKINSRLWLHILAKALLYKVFAYGSLAISLRKKLRYTKREQAMQATAEDLRRFRSEKSMAELFWITAESLSLGIVAKRGQK